VTSSDHIPSFLPYTLYSKSLTPQSWFRNENQHLTTPRARVARFALLFQVPDEKGKNERAGP